MSHGKWYLLGTAMMLAVACCFSCKPSKDDPGAAATTVAPGPDISTVGPGKDYPTLQAWWDSVKHRNRAQWAECYSGADVGMLRMQGSDSPFVATPSNYHRIYVAEGYGHDGHTLPSGAYVRMTGKDPVGIDLIRIHRVRIEGLCIISDAERVGTPSGVHTGSCEGTVLRDLLIGPRGNGGLVAAMMFDIVNTGGDMTSYVVNCTAIKAINGVEVAAIDHGGKPATNTVVVRDSRTYGALRGGGGFVGYVDAKPGGTAVVKLICTNCLTTSSNLGGFAGRRAGSGGTERVDFVLNYCVSDDPTATRFGGIGNRSLLREPSADSR